MDIPYSLKVIAGHATLTKQEILDLEIGDIIVLEEKWEELFTLKIQEKGYFKGSPGPKAFKKTIKIENKQ